MGSSMRMVSPGSSLSTRYSRPSWRCMISWAMDKARSRQSGGTGLGLSIAQEIMNQHEGRLYLVDKTEPGLTIRMELPVRGPREEARDEE